MSQTVAHLVDHVIPNVPVRQWVLSLPIPLRLLLVARPELVTPVLQVVQRVITLCADIAGFSLHAAVHCGADDCQALDQLCHRITRPAVAKERVLHTDQQRGSGGDVLK